MASPENADDDDDDFFKEVYGREYSGPLAGRDSARAGAESQEVLPVKTRESSEEREVRDPNELPTDFTTREAKLWDAKAKAMERNWKRRREEELTCRLCGEVGHFAQGCPTTLGGGGGRPGEHVHRMPIRDRRLKPRLIGTAGSVIQGIEKSSGCRVKLEDNLAAGDGSFTVHITGSNDDKVKKAQDAVNAIIKQVEEEWQKQSQRKGVAGGGRVVTEHRAPPVSVTSGRPAPSRLHADVGRGETYHSPPLVSTSGPRPLPAGAGGTHFMDSDYLVAGQIAAQLELRRKWESAGGAGGLSILSTPPAVPYASSGNYNEYDDVRVAGTFANSSAVPNELPQPSSQYYSQETRGSSGNYGEPVPILPQGDSTVPSSSTQATASVSPLGSGSLYGSQRGEGTDLSAEEDMDVGYDDSGLTDKSMAVQSLEKLEEQFLEQTMALTRAQTAEEKAEQTRHAQCMADIGELYQKRMSALRAEQTSRRHAFLHRHTKRSQPHTQPYMQGEQLSYSSYPSSYPSYVHGSGGPTTSSGPSTVPQNLGSEYGADSGLPYPNRPGESISRPWVGGVSNSSSAEGGMSTRALYSMPQQGDGATFSAYDNGVYSSSQNNSEPTGFARPPPLQNLSGVSFDSTSDGTKMQSTESMKLQPHSQSQSNYSPSAGYEVLQQGTYSQGQSYGHTASVTYTPNQQQY